MKLDVDILNKKLDQPLVLIGHMAVGKTKLGKILASSLSRPFFDSDHEIEEAAGLSVAEIFKEYGEPEFRNVESKVIRRLITQNPDAVISTGGGAIMKEETQELVFSKAISLWIKADIDTIIKRVARRKGSRPLLDVKNPRKKLEELAAIREPIYNKANIQISSDEGQSTQLRDCMIKNILEYIER